MQNTPTPLETGPPGVATALGYQALYKLDDSQMDEIVPGGKDHQREHHSQPYAKTVLLRPLAERLTANRLSRVKQQVPTVKDRNREQIDQAEVD